MYASPRNIEEAVTPDREGTSPLSSHQHELMGPKQFPSFRQRLKCGWGERCLRCRRASP